MDKEQFLEGLRARMTALVTTVIGPGREQRREQEQQHRVELERHLLNGMTRGTDDPDLEVAQRLEQLQQSRVTLRSELTSFHTTHGTAALQAELARFQQQVQAQQGRPQRGQEWGR